MKFVTTRTIIRWLHLLMTIPIVGYIYSPPLQAQLYASRVRFGFLPVMVLSGLWMWKGHVVWRVVARALGRRTGAAGEGPHSVALRAPPSPTLRGGKVMRDI